ncbi:MAG: hypothetical protein GY863_25530 [bacterium]|nr:hypothetical protein [bacterium]
MIPEKFAPGIITTEGREFAISFSPDGTECFYTKSINTNTIMQTELVDGVWTEPAIADFSGKYFDFEPLFIPDGSRMYFGTMRPLEPGGESGDLHQWYLERTETGWSDPVPQNQPFRDRFVMYITFASNGNAYFTGDDGIMISEFENGRYKEPAGLGDNINYLNNSAHPYIAPDESYMVFDAHTQEGNADLYISFKDEDGSWTRAVSFGSDFNTEDEEELVSFVTYDGKYLFFSRITNTTGDIYWVDAKVIDEIRKEVIK